MGTHRYSLPIVSGILLALAFYPFYFWPLAFAALAPLFHFAAQMGRRRRELFFGGFLCGLIGVAPTVYSSLFQMRLLQGDELFSYLVRASALPMLALVACAFGALALSFALLRSRSWLFNSLIGAALYGALESGFMRLLGGYYLPSLSYAVAGFAPAFTFASIAGAGFVALLVAWVNSLVSEAIVAYRVKGHVPLSGIAVALACACALYCGAKFYSGALPQNGPAISAAVVQEPYTNPSELPTGSYADGVFSNDAVASLLSAAAAQGELVIYPFTPLQGATYDAAPSSEMNPLARVPDTAVGQWLKNFMPASTTALLWNSAVLKGVLYDQYAVWESGVKSEYEKRDLYALSDYAPSWVSGGLHGHTYTIAAGSDARAQIAGTTFGSLICSELHQQDFARAEAARSPFIIAIGSDAMFPYDLMGNYSLAAARYRAAENGIPILRGNINGPSAFINADGSIQSSLGYFERGELRGSLPLHGRIPTLFARWGAIPLYALIACALLGAVLLRLRATAR